MKNKKKLVECLQCGGATVLFMRTGQYVGCDVCCGTGKHVLNLLWIIQGAIMKQWRIDQDLTLRRAAAEYHVDPSNLSKMERGIIKPDSRYLRNVIITSDN